MATLGPKRPDGAGGQWTGEKPIRRRNPETGAYEKTGATKTIWKISRKEPWTHTDESGHRRSDSKVIVAEGADLARAYANLERVPLLVNSGRLGILASDTEGFVTPYLASRSGGS